MNEYCYAVDNGDLDRFAELFERASFQISGDPIWQSNHKYMTRRGAVWVGVTAKLLTVDFLRESWAAGKRVSGNTSRYHDLSMPHFG